MAGLPLKGPTIPRTRRCAKPISWRPTGCTSSVQKTEASGGPVSTSYFAWLRTTQRVTPMATPAGIHRSIFPIAIPSAVPTPVQIEMLTAKPSGILGISCLVLSRESVPALARRVESRVGQPIQRRDLPFNLPELAPPNRKQKHKPDGEQYAERQSVGQDHFGIFYRLPQELSDARQREDN